jgi:hypothetical protein
VQLDENLAIEVKNLYASLSQTVLPGLVDAADSINSNTQRKLDKGKEKDNSPIEVAPSSSSSSSGPLLLESRSMDSATANLIKEINDYTGKLGERDNDYRSYMGASSRFFGGINKSAKREAVEAYLAVLRGYADPISLKPHLCALQQGELGQICKKYHEIIDLNAIQTIPELTQATP